MPSYAYAPLHYIPLDSSDLLSLTLVDDIDAVNHITTQVTTAVEYTAIGFSPDLGSLDVGKDEGLFVAPAEMFLKQQDGPRPDSRC